MDGFVVAGDERGFKAAVDTSDGGSTLEDDERYEEATADLSEDRLGLFYVNTPEVFRTLQQEPGAMALGQFKDFFKDPVVATFDVDSDGVSFEADAPASLAKSLPFFGQGSALVEELPADSWLAMAQPDLGKVLEYYIEAFGASVGGRDVVESQFRSATGLDLDRDLLGWMGDFAVFVRGTQHGRPERRDRRRDQRSGRVGAADRAARPAIAEQLRHQRRAVLGAGRRQGHHAA